MSSSDMKKSPGPPPWPDDLLSTLMSDADFNSRGVVLCYPDVYALLQRLHAALVRSREVTEKDTEQRRLIPRFLVARAYSSCLAAIRLGLAGQLLESCVVLRAAIEQAWYGLHIAKDPDPLLARAEIWLRRDENEGRCTSEFSIKNVRATHREHDPATERDFHRLYRWLIEAGAHPNPMGLLSGLSRTEAARTTTFHVPIVCMDTAPLMNTIHKVVAVGVGVLKVFRLIFPERFAISGLDDEIVELKQELNSCFRKYLPPASSPGSEDASVDVE